LFSLFDGLAVPNIDTPVEDISASINGTSAGDTEPPTTNGDMVPEAAPLPLQNGLEVA